VLCKQKHGLEGRFHPLSNICSNAEIFRCAGMMAHSWLNERFHLGIIRRAPSWEFQLQIVGDP
jgi:hypothetical protein